MTKFEIDFLSDFSEQTLIEELQRIARELGQDTLSRGDIDRSGRMSSAVVLKRFGSLRKALQAAGLRPTRFMKASEQELRSSGNGMGGQLGKVRSPPRASRP
jgi:hypothetical protein